MTPAISPASRCAAPATPAQYASTSKAKPVRLLALGANAQGKTAALEFPDGAMRTIALPAEADAWHPMFAELPPRDADKLRKHARPAVAQRPDGTRTRPGPVSFVTLEVNRLGNWTGERNFDLPAEDYPAGYLTGYRCAAELLRALGRGYGPHIDLCAILRAAGQASSEEPECGPSRRGASAAFLEIVADALRFMARHARHEAFLAARISEVEHLRG